MIQDDRLVKALQRRYSAAAQELPWVRDVDRWFADFVVPYERQYLWLAKRLMGEEEAARDLLHDVYAELLTGETWRSTKKPHTWVMRAVLTRGVDRIRRSKVVSMRALPDVETLEFATQSLDGFEAVSVREQVRAGLDAINTMPDMTRRVLLLRRLDGLSVKEIAYRLGLTVKGVDYHIARGAFLFNQAMVDAGFDGVEALGGGGFALGSGKRKIVRDVD